LETAFDVSARAVYEWLADETCALSTVEKSQHNLFQMMADGSFGIKYQKSDIVELMPVRL